MPRRRRQLALPLRERPTWGGRRARAGRKPNGERAGLRHASREAFRRLPAHVTLRLRAGLPSLRATPIRGEIERTFRRGRARPGFRLVHYSLLGNHAHLIVEAVDRHALGRGMMALAARIARAVNRVAHRSGAVFADRYHSRMLQTPRECRNALRYVLLNARRHAARAAADGRVALDPASSARWFDGWKPGSLVTERGRGTRPVVAPVARARTWLLAIAWRRYGLIDPADVPG